MSGTGSDWRLPADARSSAALLDAEGARAIDRAAIASGIPELTLMERAGAAAAAAIQARWTPRAALVLAGPGNNGGDGYVVARLLRQAGWSVRVAALDGRQPAGASAGATRAAWAGAVEPLNPAALPDHGIVVDAIFGTGLARPLDGDIRATVEALNASGLPVVAIDVPTGVETDSGAILGAAVKAAMTVTFFRRKPCHLLLPGRDLAGAVIVSEIGVPPAVFGAIPATLFANEPSLWRDAFPWPTATSHKYTRGHAVVLGGTQMTGAARLAAHAAQRVGAGLVTIAADPAVVPLYAAWRADLLVAAIATREAFRDLLADRRRNAILLGPGAGVDARLEAAIGAALDSEAAIVLDADALSVVADRANGLMGRLGPRVLMTPHEGEFRKLFGDPSPRLTVARAAARETGATILLKGSDTVIAAPDGAAAINTGAPADLATAGAGDVLAGLAVGMLANRLPPLPAALIACWIHGRAAASFGAGVLAGDLPDMVPKVLTELRLLDPRERFPRPSCDIPPHNAALR